MIRPKAKEMLWRWRELGVGIIVWVLGLYWFVQSFGLLKWTGAGFVLLGLFILFVGQQRGRFRHSEKGIGVVDVVEGQITYFEPNEGGTISVAEITAVSLISHRGNRCWCFDERGQVGLIIQVSAKEGEQLFDTFAEIDGFPLEQMLRQLADETIQNSVVWRRVDCGHDQKYLH